MDIIKQGNNPSRARSFTVTTVCTLIILAFGGFLARCAFYGIHTPDESFYLTVPYRIFLGDALLINEWHVEQFSSFLQYLPMAAFLKFTGTTDGIILFFRLLFVISQTAVAGFVFFRTKRFGALCGLFSALLFLVYVPEYVEMLDYYTMSLMAFELIAVILFTSKHIPWAAGVFVGILIACAVTAQPFNAFAYFGYSLAVLICFIRAKKKKGSVVPRYISLGLWGSVTAGVFLTAILFFVFVFSRESLSDFIHNIPILFQKYDHAFPLSGQYAEFEFGYVTLIKTLFHLHPAGLCLSLLLTAGLLIDRRRKNHRFIWLCVLCSFYLFYLIYLLIRIFSDPVQNMFSPFLLFCMTLHCFLLTKNRNVQLLRIWGTGIVYLICLGFISQAMNYVGVIGCVVSNTAFCPAVKDLCAELRRDIAEEEKKRLLKSKMSEAVLLITCAVCSVGMITANTLSLAVCDRYDMLIQKKPETTQNTITEGPLRGIMVTKSEESAYLSFCSDMKTMNTLAPGCIFIDSLLPWLYLASEYPPATFTTWHKDQPELLEEYYRRVPDHLARAVYVPSVSFYTNKKNYFIAGTGFEQSFFDRYPCFKDYTVIPGKAGIILIAPDK